MAQFLEQHGIQQYRVAVASSPPHTLSCSGDYTDQIFTCDKMLVGTEYLISVKGLFCEGQEGVTASFNVYPQSKLAMNS